MKINKNQKVILCCCSILALISIIDIIYHLLIYGISLHDYIWIWKECAAALRKYDVIEAIRNNIFISGVGQMTMPRSATTPWARIMGNVIHPGFLPEKLAIVYGVVIYFLVIVWTWYKVSEHCKEWSIDNWYRRALFTLFVISPIYWSAEIGCWNNGVVLGYLAFLAAIYSEDNKEYLAGFLIGLASIKPQISALFFIAFLVRGKYKTIVSAIITILSSWGIYCIGSKVNPIVDLFSFLGGTNNTEDFWWYGWLDFLTDLGISYSVVMMISMVLGAVLCLIGCIVLKKYVPDTNIIVFYSIPCVISFYWSYKSVEDWIVVSVINILVIILCEDCLWNRSSTFVGMFFLIIMNINVFSGAFRRILGYSWNIGLSLDAWGRTIIYVITIHAIVKNELISKRW